MCRAFSGIAAQECLGRQSVGLLIPLTWEMSGEKGLCKGISGSGLELPESRKGYPLCR